MGRENVSDEKEQAEVFEVLLAYQIRDLSVKQTHLIGKTAWRR